MTTLQNCKENIILLKYKVKLHVFGESCNVENAVLLSRWITDSFVSYYGLITKSAAFTREGVFIMYNRNIET